jgi:hypothetical protein
MVDKRLSASDLAREVWGTAKDYRGYTVSRGRDRIGRYLEGTSFPEKENLIKIAKALGVPLAKLEKARPPPTVRRAESPNDLRINIYQTGPKVGQAFVSLKRDLPLDVALAIVKLITDADIGDNK